MWCLPVRATGNWKHVLRRPGLKELPSPQACQPCDCHPPISVPLPYVLQHCIPNIHFPYKGMWVSPGQHSPSGPGHCLLSAPGLCRWPARSSCQKLGSLPSQRRGRSLESNDSTHMRKAVKFPRTRRPTLAKCLLRENPFKDLTLRESSQNRVSERSL